jgi:hypothetical protein
MQLLELMNGEESAFFCDGREKFIVRECLHSHNTTLCVSCSQKHSVDKIKEYHQANR